MNAILRDPEVFSSLVNNELNPVKYISIDPGKSTGFCGYDVRYYVQFSVTLPAQDLTKFLELFKNVDVCVLEDYRIFPHKAKDHVYSDLETTRVIGRVESWAERKEVELVKQPSSIKPNGYAFIGKKPLSKSNPNNHWMDAHVHFMYWGIKSNRINPTTLLSNAKDN